MQRILVNSQRTALVSARREAVPMRVGAAQQRFVSCRVASLENVGAQMEADASFDKDEAYRRFEELLGTADVSFNQGDKVRVWLLWLYVHRLMRNAGGFVVFVF
jgi:hypothetical protein